MSRKKNLARSPCFFGVTSRSSGIVSFSTCIAIHSRPDFKLALALPLSRYQNYIFPSKVNFYRYLDTADHPQFARHVREADPQLERNIFPGANGARISDGSLIRAVGRTSEIGCSSRITDAVWTTTATAGHAR